MLLKSKLESLLVKKVVVDHQRIYWCGMSKKWKKIDRVFESVEGLVMFLFITMARLYG